MKCTVSDIESFRYWKASEYDPDAKELIAQLRKQTPPTPEMATGSAFHKALEYARNGEYEHLGADGYRFYIKTGLEIELPELREVMFPAKIYRIGNQEVRVTGRVDCLLGKRIDDHKTTGEFKPERYLDSFQWRFYLDMFNADHFRWNVFVLWEMNQKDLPDCPDFEDGKEFLVAELHRLDQYRYPEMTYDLHLLLYQFVDFAQVHLPERFAEKIAA